jgi:hypothetical protein
MRTAQKVRAERALPIVAAEWRRSDRETIRVTLHGDVIDVRCFFIGDAHEPLRPGHTGITLSLAYLPAMAEGLAAAHREALERGLIEGAAHG